MDTPAPASISYWSPIKITSELSLRCISEAASRHARGRLIGLGCGAKPYEPIFAPFVDSYFGVDIGATADLHYGEGTKADLLIDGTDTKLPAARKACRARTPSPWRACR